LSSSLGYTKINDETITNNQIGISTLNKNIAHLLVTMNSALRNENCCPVCGSVYISWLCVDLVIVNSGIKNSGENTIVLSSGISVTKLVSNVTLPTSISIL